jgi:hypothetical protein
MKKLIFSITAIAAFFEAAPSSQAGTALVPYASTLTRLHFTDNGKPDSIIVNNRDMPKTLMEMGAIGNVKLIGTEAVK